jgi:hypothetical protein
MERKVKYNYEFKLRCVEEVLRKHRNERIKLNLKEMSPIQYRAHYYQN